MGDEHGVDAEEIRVLWGCQRVQCFAEGDGVRPPGVERGALQLVVGVVGTGGGQRHRSETVGGPLGLERVDRGAGRDPHAPGNFGVDEQVDQIVEQADQVAVLGEVDRQYLLVLDRASQVGGHLGARPSWARWLPCWPNR